MEVGGDHHGVVRVPSVDDLRDEIEPAHPSPHDDELVHRTHAGERIGRPVAPSAAGSVGLVHVLDNPVWAALAGPQQDLALTGPLAARFQPEVSRFGGFPEMPTAGHWIAMSALVGPTGVVSITGLVDDPPSGWTVVYDGVGVQMTGEAVDTESHEDDLDSGDELVVLGDDDVEEMVALVALAQPGPFEARTFELGGYVGVHHDGKLVAMAGQRMRPPGWCEISAVATHPEHRGRGFAGLLVRTVIRGIRARGETPFLHTSIDNTAAIRLYENMGFSHRRRVRFLATEPPS